MALADKAATLAEGGTLFYESHSDSQNDSTPRVNLDILTFLEHPEWGNISLYPVQRVVLKLLYNLPLSPIPDRPIVLRDYTGEHIEHVFVDEQDFVNFLYDRGLCSTRTPKDFAEGFLAFGRRGTKTMLSVGIIAYELYKVLNVDNTHEYLRVTASSEINLTASSNKVSNANKQIREITKLVYSIPFFQDFIVNPDPSTKGFYLRTPESLSDRSRSYGDIFVASSVANFSARGENNIVISFDEIAHFRDSGKQVNEDNKTLDYAAYDSMTPSVAGFVNPDTGGILGKIIAISSPNGKKGLLYSKSKDAIDSDYTLFMRLPSWWVNENISYSFLVTKYKENPISFRQEFGAEFLSGSSGYIQDPDALDRAFRAFPSSLSNGSTAFHTVGIDAAMSGDGFVFTVSTFVPSESDSFGRYVVKYQNHVHKPTKEEIEANPEKYAALDPNKPAVLLADVHDEFRAIKSAFPNSRYYFDQWSFEVLVQGLVDNKILSREFLLPLFATTVQNDLEAKLLLSLLADDLLDLPNCPVGEALKDELMTLQARVITNNKLKVEAPAGLHDDRFDSLTRSLHPLFVLDKTIFLSLSGHSSASRVVSNGTINSNSAATYRANGLRARLKQKGIR